MAYDNVSSLRDWLSDSFCRIATGAATAYRQLYTDQDEVLFQACRPILMNGIDEFVNRLDLIDRSLIVSLASISESSRRTANELWCDFEKRRPQILGALLDGVVAGIRQMPHVALKGSPRMADFAHWAAACETAYWPTGTFAAAYEDNRLDAISPVVEADPIIEPIRKLLKTRASWVGTATSLLDALAERRDKDASLVENWPTSPRVLSSQIKRLSPVLRRFGIDVGFKRSGKSGERQITLERTDLRILEVVDPSSASSAVSEKNTVKLSAINMSAKGGIDLNLAKRQDYFRR